MKLQSVKVRAVDAQGNPLTTLARVSNTEWKCGYSREDGVFETQAFVRLSALRVGETRFFEVYTLGRKLITRGRMSAKALRVGTQVGLFVTLTSDFSDTMEAVDYVSIRG